MNGSGDMDNDTNTWSCGRKRLETETVLALVLHVDKVPTGRLKISLTGTETFKSVQHVSGFIMSSKREEAKKCLLLSCLGR